MAEDEIQPVADDREQALLRLKKRRDFQGHAAAFVVVNTAVWVLWAVNGGGSPWPAWLTGLWGIGLVMNAWDVYLRRPITEAEVERELSRLHSSR